VSLVRVPVAVKAETELLVLALVQQVQQAAAEAAARVTLLGATVAQAAACDLVAQTARELESLVKVTLAAWLELVEAAVAAAVQVPLVLMHLLQISPVQVEMVCNMTVFTMLAVVVALVIQTQKARLAV
jgi:hypothetical protein